jgi:predicted anti-sigma-YlaC factor YlaD
MNEHVTPWLAAYHDGELKGRRLRQVEAHLAECAACRAELNELHCLSALMQESPAAEGLLPPERFVAQVGLRLERRPTQPAWQRTLETGWRLAPAGLVGAWAFVQAVFIVAGVALIVLQASGIDVLGLQQATRPTTWLAAGMNYLGAELSDTTLSVLKTLNVLALGLTLYFTATITIVILYWSWLASLWARRRHQQIQAKAQLTVV